jgi:hypothetical protein
MKAILAVLGLLALAGAFDVYTSGILIVQSPMVVLERSVIERTKEQPLSVEQERVLAEEIKKASDVVETQLAYSRSASKRGFRWLVGLSMSLLLTAGLWRRFPKSAPT